MIKESKVIGGIGEKKSNGGTQWFMQDRIYDGDISITIATCCNPYYLVGGGYNFMKNGENDMLRIRKLTPLECCRLMGADDSVDQKLKEAGLSDAQRYHIYGDSLVVQIVEKIFQKLK